MFEFKDKTIFIVSPQKWGKMHISKHHYALELAKRGNLVYYFNPPLKKISRRIEIVPVEEISNLYIITYSFFFPYNLRFHFRALFNKLQKISLHFIKKKIMHRPDIVWCFDTNVFADLNVFGNALKIYHPADNIAGNHQGSILKSADFVFSVSDVIINDLKEHAAGKPIHFINHGLSDFFHNKTASSKVNNSQERLTAYFVGNLLLNSLDREITKKIISDNPNIDFVFIGAYKKSNISGSPDSETVEFISYLKICSNVILKDVLHPSKVADEIQNADLLLVLINPQKDINNGSNSHKILEYLSVGKVIVSNHISTYVDKRELIEMVDEMYNDNLPALFQKVISNLEYYNSPELQRKRKEYALDNTYEKQIQRIEKIISENFGETN